MGVPPMYISIKKTHKIVSRMHFHSLYKRITVFEYSETGESRVLTKKIHNRSFNNLKLCEVRCMSPHSFRIRLLYF